jgi:hypothetical protein
MRSVRRSTPSPTGSTGCHKPVRSFLSSFLCALLFLAAFSAWPFLLAAITREASTAAPEREKVYQAAFLLAVWMYALAFAVVSIAVHSFLFTHQSKDCE